MKAWFRGISILQGRDITAPWASVSDAESGNICAGDVEASQKAIADRVDVLPYLCPSHLSAAATEGREEFGGTSARVFDDVGVTGIACRRLSGAYDVLLDILRQILFLCSEIAVLARELCQSTQELFRDNQLLCIRSGTQLSVPSSGGIVSEDANVVHVCAGSVVVRHSHLFSCCLGHNASARAGHHVGGRHDAMLRRWFINKRCALGQL
ncbi:hypothetical protein N9L68_00870 [bacterium]|nr:hypothetical protein [bacterium]